RPILGLELPLPHGIADHEHGLLERQRFLDEVERAHLDGPDGRLDVAVPRNHHDWSVDAALTQPGEGRKPVDPGQPDVEDDGVVWRSRSAVEAGLTAVD